MRAFALNGIKVANSTAVDDWMGNGLECLVIASYYAGSLLHPGRIGVQLIKTILVHVAMGRREANLGPLEGYFICVSPLLYELPFIAKR